MSGGSIPASLTSIVLLASWFGAALLVAAVVAPAAFAVLPTRTLAGALVGRTLPVIFIAGVVFGAIVMFLNGAMHMGKGVTVFSALLAAANGAALLIGVQISRARASMNVPIDALDITDPRRIAFGRLHGLSVACMGLGMIAATIATVVIVRHLSTRVTPIGAPR